MKLTLTLITALLLAPLTAPAAQPAAKATAAPAYAVAVPKPTFTEVRYGTHERQILDFWKAESPTPTPVVFVIHGGGWQGGRRKSCINLSMWPHS
jgi:acetyl esterase/lipase